MSNPIEGTNVDKSKQPDLLQVALKRAGAAREDLKQKRPESLTKNKPDEEIMPLPKELEGKVDGGDVKAVVDNLLS